MGVQFQERLWKRLHGHNEPNCIRQRMDHAAAFYGCIMVVHGGYHTETMEYLGDFGFYDVYEKEWICPEILYDAARPRQRSRLEKLGVAGAAEARIEPRMMHSLTKVFVPSTATAGDAETEYRRALWVTPQR